jgi:hypothetical protein
LQLPFRGGVIPGSGYILNVKREQAMTILLAGGLLSYLPATHAALSDDHPYKGIINRNPFALVPPAPPVPVVTAAPPSNVQLTGITSLLGKKMAMLMATPNPAREKSRNLTCSPKASVTAKLKCSQLTTRRAA